MPMNICCPEYLTVIAGRNIRQALLDALSECGGLLVITTYGKGSVQASYLQDMFGLIPEEHKVIISCIVCGDKVDKTLSMLEQKFHFDKPNTGIAFTVPLDKLSL